MHRVRSSEPPTYWLERFSSPYDWGIAKGLVADEMLDHLQRHFPEDALTNSISAKGHYSLRDLTLIDGGLIEPGVAELPTIWAELCEELLVGDLGAELAEIAASTSEYVRGRMASTSIKVRLCSYGPGDVMLPHTDQESRVATFILYLNEVWQEGWGGELSVLSGPSGDRVHAVCAPEYGKIAFFIRSECSWHMVRPVSPTAGQRRLTILMQFVN